jgi:hypothetical protein
VYAVGVVVVAVVVVIWCCRERSGWSRAQLLVGAGVVVAEPGKFRNRVLIEISKHFCMCVGAFDVLVMLSLMVGTCMVVVAFPFSTACKKCPTLDLVAFVFFHCFLSELPNLE